VSDFDKGFELVVGVEGGYQSPQDAIKKRDPGGETKFGISKRKYPQLDIANLTIEQAKVIYKKDYWDLVKGDQLPFPLNVFVFDSSVNQGIDAAKRLLQKTLNEKIDGIITVETLQKAQHANKEVMALYMADRALRYTGTRNFDLDGRGWLKRLFVITLEVK
jgi:lysozyme family protein